jgi:O-methyltransferase
MRFLVNAEFNERWRILSRFQEISNHLSCEQSEPEAILVATRLLALPSDLTGDIVECGCYQGGSTAKLSVIAKKIGRKVVVFDSFMGLPEGVETYRNIQTGEQVTFRQGDYAAGLEQVQKNVSEFGEPSMVDYIPGFFQDTMPRWNGRAAAIVLDVDLVESTKVCLQYLWPRLSPKGILFSQDCHLAEVCNLLSNREFWLGLNEMTSPKFVGLGRAKMVYGYKTL